VSDLEALASSTASPVAAFESVEKGIYPASEVADIKGISIVGPLPAGIELNIVYGGAAMTGSAAPDAAAAFVKFMAGPENRGVWKEAGFEPPH